MELMIIGDKYLGSFHYGGSLSGSLFQEHYSSNCQAFKRQFIYFLNPKGNFVLRHCRNQAKWLAPRCSPIILTSMDQFDRWAEVNLPKHVYYTVQD